jgi:hypothetical protein
MFNIDEWTDVRRSPTIELHASDLCSKWGFGDGDMCDHELLIKLVRENLAPLLDERVVLEEICTCHNPIRATDETIQFVDRDISVIVTHPDCLKGEEDDR